MMVRWMCRVSLKDRKRSVDLYSLLGVQSVDEVVRRGRLRWFGHVERKSGDDWVSACRNVVVAGVRCAGRGKKTWYECVKDDMKALGLQWAVFRDMWRGFIGASTKLCMSGIICKCKQMSFQLLFEPTNVGKFLGDYLQRISRSKSIVAIL